MKKPFAVWAIMIQEQEFIRKALKVRLPIQTAGAAAAAAAGVTLSSIIWTEPLTLAPMDWREQGKGEKKWELFIFYNILV